MISVIIPAYNDEGTIQKTIKSLQEKAYTRLLQEIIVVDSGSSDNTVSVATAAGAKVVRSIRREHSAMMNLGADHATGKILYFISPGAIPPSGYCTDIVRATLKHFSFGLFSASFSDNSWLHKAISWVSRRKLSLTRLDYQSLFVVRELFEKAGRFRGDLSIMEDRELVTRLQRYSGYIILKEKILAPTKHYFKYGIMRAELGYMATLLMYFAGYPQEKLVRTYNTVIGKNKSEENQTEILSPSLT